MSPSISFRTCRPGDQPDVARTPSMSTGMDAPSTSMKFLLFLSIGRWIGGTSLCLLWRLSSYPKPSLYRREAAPLADHHQHLLCTYSFILSKLIDRSQKNYSLRPLRASSLKFCPQKKYTSFSMHFKGAKIVSLPLHGNQI
jgi:hypothetical protein